MVDLESEKITILSKCYFRVKFEAFSKSQNTAEKNRRLIGSTTVWKIFYGQ